MPPMPDRNTFESMYAASPPPWDIGRPQPPFVAAADQVRGSVLDAGCGTGENALFFAARGCQVTGIDFLEGPIAQARRKAEERGLTVRFLVQDALTLQEWTERFDNALDSGLFHVFSDEDRRRYVQGLAAVLRPGGRLFLLCFSDAEPGTDGPRRVAKSELDNAFTAGWAIESIEASRFAVRPDVKDFQFSPGGPHAWFAIVRRL